MSTVEKVTDGLDQVKAMLSDGEYKIEEKSANKLSDMLQRRFDAMPEADKKTKTKKEKRELMHNEHA